MKICIKCGYVDNVFWRHSRFDYDADYMRFDDAEQQPELKNICFLLREATNKEHISDKHYTYYRRGTGGIWLYRVLTTDYKMPRERKSHKLNYGSV
jgi:hypothetical protein